MWDNNSKKVSGSDIANGFSKQRDFNVKLIARYKNMISYLNAMEGIDNYQKEHIAQSSLFNSNNNLSKLFDSLSLSVNNVHKVLTEFIKVREDENSNIKKFMANLNNDAINSAEHLRIVLINYNQRKSLLSQQLSGMLPGLIKETNEVIGMQDLTVENSAENYTKFINDLIESIQADLNKKVVFNAFVDVVRYLNRYKMDVSTLMQDPSNILKSHLGGLPLCITNNFFRSNFGNTVLNELNKKIDNLSSVSNSDYYNHLKKDIKETDMDKWTQKTLIELVGNCKSESSSNEGLKEKILNIFKIPEIVKPENSKKEWIELKNKLYDKLNNYGVSIIEGSNFNEISFNLKIGKHSINEIENGDFDLKEIISDINSILKYEDSFYNFLDLNKSILKLKVETVNAEVVNEEYYQAVNELKEENQNLKTELDKLSFVLQILTGNMGRNQ